MNDTVVQSYHLLTHTSKWLLSLFLHSSVASSTAGRVGSQTTSPTNPTFLLQNRDPRPSFSQQPRNPNTTQNLETILDSRATLHRQTLPLTSRSPSVPERLRPAPHRCAPGLAALVLPGRRQPRRGAGRSPLGIWRLCPLGGCLAASPPRRASRRRPHVRGAHAPRTRRANEGCALRAEEQRRSHGGGRGLSPREESTSGPRRRRPRRLRAPHRRALYV